MHNKFYLLLLFLSVVALHSHAQTITQQSFSTASGQWNKEGIQLSFTVGELSIKSFTDSVISIGTGLFGKQTMAVPKEEPLMAGTISISAASFCTNGSATLKATGYTAGRQYQWQYSSDSFTTDIHDLAGATAPDSANTGLAATTTYYRLKACCISAGIPVYSTIVTLTINQPPLAPVVSFSGAAAFCAGDSVTLTSSSPTGNQWFNAGTAIAGATGQTYEAIQSGSYTVVGSSNGCFSDTSAAIVITVYPVPPKPAITQAQNKLISTAPEGNQWYLNDIAIVGARDTAFVPAVSGLYSVQVALNGCNSPQSDVISYVTTDNNSPLENLIQIFPNPFSSKIMVVNKSTEPLSVQLFDASGRLALSKQIPVGSYEFQTSILAKGLYLMKITGKELNRSTSKLIIKTQ